MFTFYYFVFILMKYKSRSDVPRPLCSFFVVVVVVVVVVVKKPFCSLIFIIIFFFSIADFHIINNIFHTPK